MYSSMDLAEGETSEIEVAEGKTLIVQLIEIGKLDAEGNRTLDFEINGNRREIKIKDKTERILGNSKKIVVLKWLILKIN